MRRLLAVAAVAVAAAFPVSAHAAPAVGAFGGQCDGVVDFGCRTEPCTQELDCGLVPPCFVWVAATGCLL